MNGLINSCITMINDIGRGFCNFTGSMFIQSTMLILLLLVIDILIRKRVRATFRYWIWMLVFIKLVLPPTLSSPTGIGNLFGEHFSADSIVAEQPANPVRYEHAAAGAIQRFTEPAAVPQIQTVQAFSEPVTPAVSNPPDATSTETIAAAPSLKAMTWQGIVFLFWLVGVFVIAVLLIQRILFVEGLIAQSKPAKNRLVDILDNCRQQVGVRRNIRLRLSHNVTSPAVCGLFRPVILIPGSLLEQLSREKLRAVLIHELAHIKRGDLWINCVQTFLQIAYFYNPFLWLANLIVRRIREQAVDEMVLVTLGTEAKSYSNTLIDIAEMAFSRPTLSLRLVGVVESKKALSCRIRHILSRPFPKSAKLGIAGLLAIIVTAVVLLPMAKVQMSRSHTAIGSDSDTYSILLLDNTDSEYEGKDRYDDRLYILDRKGNINGAVSGLNICETAGCAHMLAVDEKRKTLWVAENVGCRLWHFDLTTGDILQRISDLKASALAIDPLTGDVWVITSGGKIDEGSVKVVSVSGRIKAEYEIPGFDIAYNSFDKSFWIIGKNIYKVDRDGKILGQITGQIPYTAVSVSIDPKSGNAWTVVRAHLQIPDSKPELWIINKDMQIEQRIDLGELNPYCVSVDSDNDIVWVGCLSTTLRFTTSGDKLKTARHISGFSVVPGPSRDSVVAASQFGLALANVKESGYVEIGDMSERFGAQLGSSQKWLAVVPFANATLNSSQELAYLTKYKSREEYPELVEKLKSLGRAIFMYANDYDDKFPDTLQDLHDFVNSVELKWLVKNVEYLGKGKTTSDPPNIVVTYDKTVLKKGEGTLVLYADGHVAYENPDTLIEIGIKPNLKTDVQVAVKDSGIKAEEETLQAKKIFLPDVDEKGLMLDLESGELVDVPKAETKEQIAQALNKLKKGDIVFDTSALILVRGATSPSLSGNVDEPFKTYKIGQNLPEILNVRAKDGIEYTIEIHSIDKDGCQFEYYPVHPKHYVSASPLTTLERTLIKQVLNMVRQVEEKYPDAATHWPEGPGLYHVDSQGNVTVWHYQKLWHRTNNDSEENEVGYGSSELVKATGMYYLPDGTPLQSRWRERGGGMKDIRVNIGRPLEKDERIGLINRHDLSSDSDLLSRDGRERNIVLHSYQNLPIMVAVRIDRPLQLGSWGVGDIEADVQLLDDYDQITLSGSPDRSISPMLVSVRSLQGKAFGQQSDTQLITEQSSEGENVQFVRSTIAANTTGNKETQIVLQANVFSVNAPKSLITDYLHDEFGIQNITTDLTETQAAQLKKWITALPDTTMISSPKTLVYDGEQTDLNVTTQHEFIVDYEKTSDSPPQYKPKRQKFMTGVELELTPELAKDNSIVHLILKLNQTELEKVEEKKHESGNIIQLPIRTNTEMATQVAVPVGKYFLVPVAGMYSEEKGSKPDQPVKQTILLIKADIMNKESEGLSRSETQMSLPAQLKHITDEMIQAFNDGNIEKMLSYFADDAIVLPDQHEIAIGKDSLRNLYLANKKENTKINSVNCLEQKLWICRDLIFETGKVVMSFTIPESTLQQSSWLNYVAVRSRQPDGSIQTLLDSSNPAPIPEDGNIPEPSKPVVINITSGVNPSEEDMEAVYGKIRQYESTFHKAFIDHDIEVAAGFYADDAILMPWRQNTLKGKKDITEYINKSFAELPMVAMTQKVCHVEGNSRMLYAVNMFTWTFKDPSSGQDSTIPGKGVHVWSLQRDGSWKILLDLNNPSIPVGDN